jgi:hypothetical protein
MILFFVEKSRVSDSNYFRNQLNVNTLFLFLSASNVDEILERLLV